MKQIQNIGYSYYELSLLQFLRESHPERASDTLFIKTRAALAAEAYAEAFNEGTSVPECAEVANRTLYAGLHFSKHDTIVAVLWNEFSAEIPAEKAKAAAIRLQPMLEEVFQKYELSDRFDYAPEYPSLYTEITGTLQLKLEDDGCL